MKDGMVKLGDFGIAKVLSRTVQKAKTMVGTPYYISPEIVENKPYSFATDIWSLGVVLYEMCAKKPPFDANSLHFLALKIIKGKYKQIPRQYSQGLKTLLKQMLETKAGRRPTIHQILKDPLLQVRIPRFLDEEEHKKEFDHTVLHNQRLDIGSGSMIKTRVVGDQRKVKEAQQKQRE